MMLCHYLIMGKIQWGGEDIGKLVVGPHLLSPQIDIIGGELGSPVLRDQAAGPAS